MQTQIDLTKWCDPEATRFPLGLPFVQGGFLCATNGRIAIRVPSSDPDTTPENGGRLPRMADIFKSMPKNISRYEAWPEAKYSHQERDCLTCKGKGRVNQHPCQECDGDGMVECETCGHEDECKVCDGHGECGGSKCKACNGKMQVPRPYQQQIGKAWIDADYDAMVRELPNPVWYCKSADDPVFIIFDGGEAVVMPFAAGGR